MGFDMIDRKFGVRPKPVEDPAPKDAKALTAEDYVRMLARFQEHALRVRTISRPAATGWPVVYRPRLTAPALSLEGVGDGGGDLLDATTDRVTPYR